MAYSRSHHATSLSGLAVLALAVGLVAAAPAHADLLVCSFFGDQVLRYDETTGAFLGIFASGGGLDGPIGLAFGLDGNLYVSSHYTAEILRFNGLTGAFMDVFVPANSSPLLYRPHGLAFGPDGDLYVASGYSGGCVLRYNGSTGAFMGTVGRCGFPSDLDFGPDGSLYVRQRQPHYRLERYRYNGTTFELIDESGWVPDGEEMAFGPDGNIYINTAYYTGEIQRYSGSSLDFLGTFIPGPVGQAFAGLIFGPDGNLYVASVWEDNVRRYSGTTGAFLNVFIPTGSGGLKGPWRMLYTPFIRVNIDIKPGSYPNSINLGSGGTVPVAIFSTPTFDARTVIPASVTLAGASVKLKGNGTPMSSVQDVNGDGLPDLVVHVSTEALQPSPTDTEAVLEGQTTGGRRIRGTDTIRVVP